MTPLSSPSVSQTPSSLAALAQSGEWRLGDAVVSDASRSSFGSSRLQVQRRRGGGALLAGALIGLTVLGVGVAFRLGHLDGLLASVQASEPTPQPAGPKAKADASVRLRIKTEPSGADVFDVTGGVPKLLGLTPLVVPWEVRAGDGGRTLQLKLRGHIPAQARVEPPTPSVGGEPVWLDVEATLRPLPPR